MEFGTARSASCEAMMMGKTRKAMVREPARTLRYRDIARTNRPRPRSAPTFCWRMAAPSGDGRGPPLGQTP